MKRGGFLICFLLIFCGNLAKAQLVNYRKEMVYVDDKLYAYLFKTGSIWAKNFSMQSLKNEEVMQAKPISKEMDSGYEYVYYEVSFKGTDKKAEIEDSKDFSKRLAHELGIFAVLVNDEINPAGVQKFIDKYPNTISKKLETGTDKLEIGKPAAPTPEIIAKEEPLRKLDMEQAVASSMNMPLSSLKTSDKVVETPKPFSIPNAAPAVTKIATIPGLKINGAAILKGTKAIGKFTVSEEFINDKLKKTYSFYNSKKIKVATATYADTQKPTCKIYSLKDKKSRTITTTVDSGNLKLITGWLVQNRYL